MKQMCSRQPNIRSSPKESLHHNAQVSTPTKVGVPGKFLSVLMAAVLFMSGFALFSVGAGQGGGGSTLRQAIWVLLCLAAVIASVREQYWGGRFKLPRLSGAILTLPLLFATASFLWSYDPGITLRRAALFAVLLVICYTVFNRGQAASRPYLTIIAWPVAALLLFSALAAAIVPSYAITDIGWRGITAQKNELGQIAALGVLLSVAALAGRHRSLALAACGFAAVMLVLSRSATSAVGLAAALAVLGGVAVLRRMARSRQWMASMISLAVVAIFIVHACFVLDLFPRADRLVDSIFGLAGKSSNLTGRTDLWYLVWLNSKFNNPWLGGGYGSFWTGPNGMAGYISWRFAGGYVGSAHNGYLEVYNEQGYLGIAIVLAFFTSYAMLWRRARFLSRPEQLFHLGLFIFVIVVNLSESTFWRDTRFLNLVLIASYCQILGTHRTDAMSIAGWRKTAVASHA